MEDLALDPNAESAAGEVKGKNSESSFLTTGLFESTLELCSTHTSAGSSLTPPCGHWLEDALVAAAFEVSNQVGRQAATRLYTSNDHPPETQELEPARVDDASAIRCVETREEQLKIEVQQSNDIAESDLLLKYRERLLIGVLQIRRKNRLCDSWLVCADTQPLVGGA